MITKENVVQIFTQYIEKYDKKNFKFQSTEDWFKIYEKLNKFDFENSNTSFEIPIATASQKKISNSSMVQINSKCKNKKIKNLYSLSLKSLYPHILVRLMDSQILNFQFVTAVPEDKVMVGSINIHSTSYVKVKNVSVNSSDLSNILNYLLGLDYDKKDESYTIYKAWINYTYGLLSNKIGFNKMPSYSNQILSHIIEKISEIEDADIYYVDTDIVYFKIDYDEMDFMTFFKDLKNQIGLPFYVKKHKQAVFLGKKKYIVVDEGKITGFNLLKGRAGIKLGVGHKASWSTSSVDYSYGTGDNDRIRYSDYIAETEAVSREYVNEDMTVGEPEAVEVVSATTTNENVGTRLSGTLSTEEILNEAIEDAQRVSRSINNNGTFSI